ncbi:hypothetical protein DPEC_G00364030 [Dallia pectoralis]|nr:hypothetical protein DPEC_G00364030 [Dallia pectoralis]
MEPHQRGDWSSTRHMTVRFDDVDTINRVEYTWVQMFDIEKRMPMSATLTEPGLDGNFRIPVKSSVTQSALYIVLRAVYLHGSDSYGLVTAKHFSDTYTDTKGHKVKRISVLARAPLAWVKMNTSRDTEPATCYFTGDTIYGCQPEMFVSRIHASIDRYVHSAFMFTLFTQNSTERDSRLSQLVSETLSILGAPLAFKVLHEQSRLTLELWQGRGGSDSLTLADPQNALWGTCVLWQTDSDQVTLTRATVNQQTDPLHRPCSAHWLRVRLTYTGLEVTRSSAGTYTKDFIRAPYWAVVLTALCCGALTFWTRELDKLCAALRVDDCLLSSEREKDELCQRCGYPYRASPVACEPEPKRVSAVLQIDKLLLGSICTTLCATVARNADDARIAEGSEGGARDPSVYRPRADWEPRYCLNHRRVYSASREETRELDKCKGERWEERLQQGEDDQMHRQEDVRAGSSWVLGPGGNREAAHQIASWWEFKSRCYWGLSYQNSSLGHRESLPIYDRVEYALHSSPRIANLTGPHGCPLGRLLVYAFGRLLPLEPLFPAFSPHLSSSRVSSRLAVDPAVLRPYLGSQSARGRNRSRAPSEPLSDPGIVSVRATVAHSVVQMLPRSNFVYLQHSRNPLGLGSHATGEARYGQR